MVYVLRKLQLSCGKEKLAAFGDAHQRISLPVRTSSLLKKISLLPCKYMQTNLSFALFSTEWSNQTKQPLVAYFSTDSFTKSAKKKSASLRTAPSTCTSISCTSATYHSRADGLNWHKNVSHQQKLTHHQG